MRLATNGHYVRSGVRTHHLVEASGLDELHCILPSQVVQPVNGIGRFRREERPPEGDVTAGLDVAVAEVERRHRDGLFVDDGLEVGESSVDAVHASAVDHCREGIGSTRGENSRSQVLHRGEGGHSLGSEEGKLSGGYLKVSGTQIHPVVEAAVVVEAVGDVLVELEET